jgi:hypothetical protein
MLDLTGLDLPSEGMKQPARSHVLSLEIADRAPIRQLGHEPRAHARSNLKNDYRHPIASLANPACSHSASGRTRMWRRLCLANHLRSSSVALLALPFKGALERLFTELPIESPRLRNYCMQHFLYFLPLPQGHGSFLPAFLGSVIFISRWVATCRFLQWA